MKWILWILIFLAFVTPIIFTGKGVDHLDTMKERYKRAVDAGVDAAVKYNCYSETSEVERAGFGYGIGRDDKKNTAINEEEMLDWFYRVMFRNLGIQEDEAAQLNLKRYIPMKAVVAFDRLLIADVDDNWQQAEYYEMDYNGKSYRFTLSEQLMDIESGIWLRDKDIGLLQEKRQQMVSGFIKERLNSFLNNRLYFDSGLYYDVNISVSDIDSKSDDIDGVNFIVLLEGVPLPALNPWKHESYYAFSLGGSEIER
ncbi:MAG: hypothetical protein ACOZCL_05735 [Bacillota bacterium]